jgi:hypothetical protein
MCVGFCGGGRAFAILQCFRSCLLSDHRRWPVSAMVCSDLCISAAKTFSRLPLLYFAIIAQPILDLVVVSVAISCQQPRGFY